MAENDVSQWIPSVTDDYMAGKVTFTAGSKDITFKDAFNGAEKSYTAGDSIYIPTEGRWLLLKEITSTTKGSLLYPCPESCAGTFDLLIRPLARNARQAGLATMTLRNLNVGNLPGLANAKLKTGQILVASQIAGSFDAIDLNADNIAETDNRKIMTADEREKVRKLKADLTAADIAETDARKIMTADERNKLANLLLTGNIKGTDWQGGNLYQHIENRAWQQAHDQAVAAQNWCVTDSRVAGWAEIQVGQSWSHLPSGFFATSLALNTYGTTNYFGGHQPQLYIANRGWFALGGW